MKTNQRVFVVIPTYNEAPVIETVIKDVKKAGFQNIVVVDDGSTDGTEIVAKKTAVTVVSHFLNRGKGAAAKTGIEAARLLGAEIIVTMDGDGQHNPRDIKKLTEKINNNFDIVLGNRLHSGNKIPKTRLIANFFGNFFTWFIYGLWVKDSQSGFRAYSKKILEKINTSHDRYEFDSEIIREIKKNNIKYVEVPIEVRYTKYSQNKRHKQSFTNGIKTIARLLMSP